MYNCGVNRVILSGIGGVIIPASFAGMITLASAYLGKESVNDIFRLPLELPTTIYSFFDNDPNAWYPSDGWFMAFFLGNIVFYALLTYAFLSWRNIPKRLP